jgi:hypothetical protein
MRIVALIAGLGIAGLGIAGLGLMAAASPALAEQAGADAPLQPIGAWGVDYGDAMCTLTHSFAGPDGPVELGFAPLTGGEQLRVLAVNLPGADPKGYGKAHLSDAPDAKAEGYYSTLDAKSGKTIVVIRAGRREVLANAATPVLTIELKKKAVRFAVPGLANAMTALNACETDLQKSWGYDAAAVSKPAVAIGPGSWINFDDFPRSDGLVMDTGETDFRLAVGPDGKPTQCTIMVKSGSERLDQLTCRLLMLRARFTPAKDKAGKPVAGIYSNELIWALGWEE